MGDPTRLRGRYAIAGVGLSRFGKLPGTSTMGFTLEAARRAIEDCGVARDAIDGVLALMPAVMGEQHGWASRVAAFLGLTPGFCSTVLCAFACQNNPQGVIPTLFGSPWAIPYGDVGAITFMGHVARRQMHEHGITSRQYGQIAVTWRKHAATNPLAQKRAPITLEDHQSSKLINDPLRLLDCCLVTDGGGAVIVTSLERACDLRQKPAVISGLGQVHSSEIIRPWDDGRGGGREAAEGAYRMAGCGARDIDVVQLYDGFTPLVMHELVAYGFASWDEVGALVEAGELDVGGRLPANTAGGLLSEGHLSGFGHVAEAVRQVRGTSHCQVPDVEISMVTGYGGAPHEPPPTVAYTVAVLKA